MYIVPSDVHSSLHGAQLEGFHPKLKGLAFHQENSLKTWNYSLEEWYEKWCRRLLPSHLFF